MRSTSPELQDGRHGSAWCPPPRATTQPRCATSTTPRARSGRGLGSRGSVAGLLAMWHVHGVDAAVRAAWRAGVVLTGVTAGSICWHVGGTTDSFGPDLRPVTNGLALVPFSNGVHYDSEPQRRPFSSASSPTAPCP